MDNLALAPFTRKALLSLLAGDFREAVILDTEPDVSCRAILGGVLVQEFAGRFRLGGKFAVDAVGQGLLLWGYAILV